MTDSRDADWTGVSKDRTPIAPLTSLTFVERLANLTAAATGLEKMRAAMVAQCAEYSIDDLIDMKRQADRPQHLLDIAELEAIKGRVSKG